MISLYVKTHKITGLKYFGKTTKRDPYTYLGSGSYWIRHLKKYGRYFDTEIIGQFDSIAECEEVALKFSKENNIVESNNWANLKAENGKDGNPQGIKFSLEHCEKIRQSRIGKCHNDFDNITRKKMSIAAKIRADKSVINETNNFSGERGSKFASERNKRLIMEHRHNFQGKSGSIHSTNLNNKRVKDGTHPFLKRPDGTSLNSDRVANGTHHFLKNAGTVSVVDKNGNCIRIESKVFWSQEGEKCNWTFVGITSKEAKLRLKEAKENNEHV